MRRYLEKHVKADLKSKIVLVSGPRQVGKTTLSKQLALTYSYLNYDAVRDRHLIRKQEWNRDVELIIFDELHKMKRWKAWLKGLYDTEGVPPGILVTGSARLDIYRKGGDSLAGRHFMYRLHPLTVSELAHELEPQQALDRMLHLGGFPEPFLSDDVAFAKRWRRRHLDVVLREDLRDLEHVKDIQSIELLVEMLRHRVGSTISHASLARDLEVSPHTVKHWLQILENLYVVFSIAPWHQNIARSLLKERKYYFYDTGALVENPGARFENEIARSLLRHLHYREDTAGSKVALHYLRDKDKREVDFLTVIDGVPQQMVEAKLSDTSFSSTLLHFKKFLASDTETLQVVKDLDRKRSKPWARMLPAHEYLVSL